MAKANFTRLFSNSGLHFACMKALIALLLIACICGCGGSTQFPTSASTSPRTFTSSQIFNPHVGDVWTFQSFCDGAFQTTTVTIEAAPDDAAGTIGHHIILHFQKSAPCAYWGLGVASAEDHFLLLQTPDGGWRGVADIPTFPESCPWCNGHIAATLNWHPVPGMAVPYMIVPGAITEGQTIKMPTQYHWFELWDVNTTDDIEHPKKSMLNQGTDMGISNWETDFSVEEVSTPLYTGPAVVSHQFEGSCNEEKWYFGPMGLVQITPLGSCTVIDPGQTIKRVS